MALIGRIVDGTVVFDEPVPWPDGTPVWIEIIEPDAEDPRPTLVERLGDVVGKAEVLSEDAARNVDHYLRGHRKR